MSHKPGPIGISFPGGGVSSPAQPSQCSADAATGAADWQSFPFFAIDELAVVPVSEFTLYAQISQYAHDISVTDIPM